MKGNINLCVVATTLELAAAFSIADQTTDAEVITDFVTTADGALDSPNDLLLDADPCDPAQPDLLERKTAEMHERNNPQLAPLKMNVDSG